MKKLRWLLTLCIVLILASKVRAQSAPGANNAELNGDYAFGFNGVTSNGTISSAFAAVGRFTADGKGNLSNGELDTNGVDGRAAAQAFAGTYSIGADSRGVMTLSTGAKLAFAMLADGSARFIEFDASGGVGTIGSGTIDKADTTAYSTASFAGDYAFGAAGFDNANNRAAILGRFNSDGSGTLTNAAGDVNAYGTDYVMNFTAANYAVSNAATGRGAMSLAFTFSGAPDTLNFTFYVVNSAKLFVMESDAVTTATPLLSGMVVQQQTPAGGFSNASLNGNTVISLTGLSMCGSSSGVPKAVAGLLSTNGSGALSLTYDENYCRAPNSVTGAAGTYNVASNGRAAITIGGYNLVAYLVNLNQFFLFVSDSNVLFGSGEPQAAVSFTNGSLKGAYAGFASNPVDFAVSVFSGEFAADGAGNLTGTEDIGAASGPVSGAAFQGTYSVGSSPTNGRGTATVTSGTGGDATVYMISPSKFVVVSRNDPNPAILEFEASSSSTPPAVSLSSFAVNPTSVTGGNSSTGTVTLSGPAPAGGAQVILSSSNTAAARVPSSVAIAAGATTATFAVSTSAVSSSTSASISASYSGVTRTASLTVTPAPPPPVALASLTVSPSSAIGGQQSSAGTVTLSGPAPAGGAQVMLSSSNTAAARVPSSVAIAAGATTATFAISTSAVSSSSSVSISASYSGVTMTALLTVTPVPPPPVALASLTLSPSSVVGGLESSTGRVTLSGPAPAGGVRIILGSSNGSASVPSSVVVPEGAIGATFTVNSSPVLVSTSATISASYNGNTRTATLDVLL